MDTEKRFFLAFALSMVVIIAFSWMNADRLPEPSQQKKTATRDSATPGEQPSVETQEPSSTPVPEPEAPKPSQTPPSEASQGPWAWMQPVAEKQPKPNVSVHSELYEIEFSPYGAEPLSWKLLNYEELFSDRRYLELKLKHGTPEEQRQARLELNLINVHKNGEYNVNAIDPYFKEGQAGLNIRWGGGIKDGRILYQAEQTQYTVDGDQPTDVVFRSEHEGVTIKKTYRFYPDNYRVDYEIEIQNHTGQRLAFPDRQYYDVNWFGGFGFPSMRWDARNQLITQLDGSVVVSQVENLASEYRNPTGQVLRQHYEPSRLAMTEKTVGWVAVGQKYFLSAIIPHSLTQFAMKGLSSAGGDAEGLVKPNAGVRLFLDDILPGHAHIDQFTLYVGPMDENHLAQAESGLEDANQMFLKGFTGPIAQLMLSLLQGLYTIVPNYGVAIILLTLIVKLLTWPLYHKQMTSMKKMQALQPHINSLREQYKDDPQKLQKEQMELFKKHKVNPLAGCLPMLIILPIFIALYATFNMAVELRGAPFIGWINDLSSPDRAFFIPIGSWVLPINILPLAYAAIMLVNMSQNKMEGPNAAMMRIMPIIFVFFFWGIASGVILYFLMNVIIDVIQRKVIDIMHQDEPALAAAPASGSPSGSGAKRGSKKSKK